MLADNDPFIAPAEWDQLAGLAGDSSQHLCQWERMASPIEDCPPVTSIQVAASPATTSRQAPRIFVEHRPARLSQRRHSRVRDVTGKDRKVTFLI